MRGLFLIILVKLFQIYTGQQTDNCGSDFACFKFPTECSNTQCTFIYKWRSIANSTAHHFILAAKVSTDVAVNSAWLAIGFSSDQFMGNDDVVLCKTIGSANTIVEHYFNFGKFTPGLLDPNDPRIGLSNTKVLINDRFVVCSFVREKFVNQANYFNLGANFHILAAFGPLTSTGEISQHAFKLSSDNFVNFSTDFTATIGSTSPDQVKVKTHACLMIIAWLLFAPIGMILPRYYKFIFNERTIFNLKMWFVIHRPLMLSVLILSVIGLLVILADKRWTWIEPANVGSLVHSIFGMITIGLAVLQIIIAFARPGLLHPKRFIFNGVHGITGSVILIFSMSTLITGVSLNRMNLNVISLLLIISWLVLFTIYCCFLESTDRMMKKKAHEISLAFMITTESSMNNTTNGDHNANKYSFSNIFDPYRAQVEKNKLVFLIIFALFHVAWIVVLIVAIAKAHIK